ncbi:hypothetical protein L9F63_022632, partial [Diploptera punctata]
TGFIKAFSTSPQGFTVGFAQLNHIMKTLFVKNVYLWPRFHATVKGTLDKFQPQVIELNVPLTKEMQDIQSAVLELMNFAVKEIKQSHVLLDTGEITVENAITKSFHKILQLQLDPFWHQLSTCTKQLVADLRTFRLVLKYLTQYECVTFYAFVNSLQSAGCAMRSSGWQLLDSANTLFNLSRKRVFGKTVRSVETGIEPEVNPKWEVLSEVLNDIHTLIKYCVENDPTFNKKVLILVEDSKTCNQLKQYLTIGAKEMLAQLYKKTIHSSSRSHVAEKVIESVKEDSAPVEESVTSVSALVKEETIDDPNDDEYKDNYILSQKVETELKDIEHSAETKVVGSEQTENKEEEDSASSSQKTGIKAEASYQEFLETTIVDNLEEKGYEENLNDATLTNWPVILLQTFNKHGDPLALHRTLNEVEPWFVILYNSDPSVYEHSPVYQNNNPRIKLHVYFLVYGGSVEEQAFLTALRREKEAFDFLIKEKATMVVPEDQDGKSEDCVQLSRDQSRPNLTVGQSSSSRKGGKEDATKKKTPTVIVDMREFGSDLPSLIHRRGIEVEPVTLQVGDYILTPELCVERKSVSDLIGSLNSGRLYNQALAMTRYYSKPVLLIEFDHNKPFALQGSYYVSRDIESKDVIGKLQLLTLHFPKLKIVWSPSPYSTAQLFEEMKQGRDEPNAAAAAEIGVDQNDGEYLEKWNVAIHDFVTKLPGVTTKNQHSLLLKGQSLDHLLTLSLDEIAELVNNRNEAQSLYDSLHKVYQLQEDLTSGYKGIGKGRGKKRPPLRKQKIL